MKYGLICVTAAFALTACGGGAVEGDADGDGSVSVEEAREAVAASGNDFKPEPGKYKATMTFIKAEIPGAPQQMQDMMGANMNQTYEFCLSPEEAEGGFENSFQEGSNEGCEMKTFNLDGDQVEMAMVCNPEGFAEMAVSMNGTVTPTQQDMNVKWKGSVPTMGEASFDLQLKQERIGDC